MKVWVIMENDYPHGVRLSEEAAEACVAERKERWETYRKEGLIAAKVFVRHYEFEAPQD